jgi:HUS1 checkpoint protein
MSIVQEGASQRSSETQERDERDPEQLAGVLVSVRSFLKFLNSHVVSTATIAGKSVPVFGPR